MKITYNVPGTHLTLEADVPDSTTAFSAVCHWDELFGPVACGNCNSTDTVCRHRRPKGYDFYSRECRNCGWELKYGQAKEDHRLFRKEWEAPYKGYQENKTYTREDPTNQ